MGDNDKVLTINQLAKKYGRPGPDLIRQAVLSGALEASRMAQTRTSPYLIRESAFQRWLDRHRVQAPQAAA